MLACFFRLPLLLILTILTALLMLLPGLDAFLRSDYSVARAFFYSSLLGLAVIAGIVIARSGRTKDLSSDFNNLLSLVLAYLLLPIYLAVPFYEALGTTTFLNAYLEMVSCLTTTGAQIFEAGRLTDSLHLWRGLVGWMGGLLIWVSATAVLAPLNLGGFEITASAEPGQEEAGLDRFIRASSARRLEAAAYRLTPVYAGLTGALWILLMINGERSLVALVHAMSTMATSGISPLNGMENGAAGFGGEAVIFLFMLFALSRLTFSSDTVTNIRPGLLQDPEFRLGLFLVAIVPLLLFTRHFIGAFNVDDMQHPMQALRGLWGAVFTVLSFLSTTGFVSAHWSAAQIWSGLETPGVILLGLSLVGGGVATTAGGVKLLRVYVLYLHGRREMERLVLPSSVGRASAGGRRIRRKGAFVAWIFFMLFALSIACLTIFFGALGVDFQNAVVLTISGLATTGPLVSMAAEAPVELLAMEGPVKLLFSATMVLGRLETLALIALLNPALWRD